MTNDHGIFNRYQSYLGNSLTGFLILKIHECSFESLSEEDEVKYNGKYSSCAREVLCPGRLSCLIGIWLSIKLNSCAQATSHATSSGGRKTHCRCYDEPRQMLVVQLVTNTYRFMVWLDFRSGSRTMHGDPRHLRRDKVGNRSRMWIAS